MPQYRRKMSPETYKRLIAEVKQAAQTYEVPEPEPSVVERYAPAGIRGLGMLLGVTPLRGLGASAATELLAQQMEGRFDPAEIGIAGVTGGLGGAATQSIMKNISKPLIAAIKGAAYGAAQPVVRGALDEEYEATPAGIATSAALGGGVAGGLAKLMGRIGQTAAAAPTPDRPFSKYPLLDRSSKELEQLAVAAQAEGRPDVAIDIMKRAVETPGKAAPSLMNRLLKLQQSEAKGQREATKAFEGYHAEREAAEKAAMEAEEAASQIAAARVKLDEPVEQVAETFKAPTLGGVETLRRVFSPRRSERARTPQGAIQEAVKRGMTPDEAAVEISRLEDIVPARAAVPEAPVAPVVPEVPQATAEFIGWQTGGKTPLALYNVKGGPSDKSTLSARGLEKLGIAVPETPPPPGVEAPVTPTAVEAPVSPTEPTSPDFLQGMSSLAGKASRPPRRGASPRAQAARESYEALEAKIKGELGLTPAAVPEAPVAVPKAPVASVAEAAIPGQPAQLFKTPVDVVGQAYRAAKAEEGINPLARRQLGATLQTEAKRAGLPTKGGSPEALARLLGRDVGGDIARTMPGPRAVPESPLAGRLEAPGALPAPSRADVSPVATPASPVESPQPARSVGDLMERWASEVDELQQMGMAPEKLDEASSVVLDRLMGEFPDIAKGFGGEKGEVAFPLLARLGLGATGALVGGAVSDDPVTGAMVGFGAGVTLPSLVSLAQRGATRLMTDPGVPESIKGVLSPLSQGDHAQAVRTFWDQIPDYLRAGMLSSPNFPNNFFVGPWGSGMMAGLELKLAGNPMGDRILTGMDPAAWAHRYATRGMNQAKLLLQDTQAMARERIEGVPYKANIAQFPAWGMLAGDVTTREVLQMAGMPEELARRYTLTSEPVTKLIKSIINVQRSGGTLGKVVLPFARTLGNIAEQSAARIPIVGPMIQRAHPELAYPEAIQQTQQLLGTAVPLGAGALGYIAPEESDPETTVGSRFLRSAVSNIAGPYAGLAGVGYGVGRALASDEPTLGRAAQRGVTEAAQTVPLPTADIPISWGGFMRRLLDQEPITSIPSGVPGAGFINPYITDRGTGRARRATKARKARRAE